MQVGAPAHSSWQLLVQLRITQVSAPGLHRRLQLPPGQSSSQRVPMHMRLQLPEGQSWTQSPERQVQLPPRALEVGGASAEQRQGREQGCGDERERRASRARHGDLLGVGWRCLRSVRAEAERADFRGFLPRSGARRRRPTVGPRGRRSSRRFDPDPPAPQRSWSSRIRRTSPPWRDTQLLGGARRVAVVSVEGGTDLGRPEVARLADARAPLDAIVESGGARHRARAQRARGESRAPPAHERARPRSGRRRGGPRRCSGASSREGRRERAPTPAR
jgi:hypothetical protein